MLSQRNAKYHVTVTIEELISSPAADPDLELSGGAGFDLLTLLAFLPSVISSFLPKIK